MTIMEVFIRNEWMHLGKPKAGMIKAIRDRKITERYKLQSGIAN